MAAVEEQMGESGGEAELRSVAPAAMVAAAAAMVVDGSTTGRCDVIDVGWSMLPLLMLTLRRLLLAKVAGGR